MRRQLPVSSPVSLSALVRGARGALGFERAQASVVDDLRRRYGTSTIVLTDSGTSALILALRAALPTGGTVAFPSYGCVDLAAAARFTGARVRLYDLDPVTLSADLDSLARTLRRGVDAVVAVHLYGYPADIPAMRALTQASGTVLIEDAAQAANGCLGGDVVGGLGDLSILSFGRGKGTTGGRGGALMMSEARWTARLEAHSSAMPVAGSAGWGDLTRAGAQWLFGRALLYGIPAAIPWLHLGEMVFHPAHEPEPMSRAAASLVRVALRRDFHEVARRRRHAATLDAAARASGDLRPIAPIAGAEPGYLRFAVLDAGGRAEAPVLGITRGYPRALFEQQELRSCLHADELEPLGGRHLRAALFTLPVHSRLTSTDLVRLRTWIGADDRR